MSEAGESNGSDRPAAPPAAGADGSNIQLFAGIAAVAIGGVATLLSSIGIGDVALLRLYRDLGIAAICFYTLVMVGIALEAVVALAPRKSADPRPWRSWLAVLGVLLSLGGLTLAVVMGVTSIGIRSRPDITMSFASSGPLDSTPLLLTVQSDQLSSTDRMQVLVVRGAARGAPGLRSDPASLAGDAIFRAVVGPDPDGSVDRTFSLPVDLDVTRRLFVLVYDVNQQPEVQESFDIAAERVAENSHQVDDRRTATFCQELSEEVLEEPLTACMEYVLPMSRLQPTLALQWSTDAPNALTITSTDDSPAPSAVHVRVRGAATADAAFSTLIYESTVSPSGQDNSLTIPLNVPNGVRMLCVEAERTLAYPDQATGEISPAQSSFAGPDACSPTGDALVRVSWIEVMVGSAGEETDTPPSSPAGVTAVTSSVAPTLVTAG